MSDDGLIAGAAAPVGARRINSVVVLDVIWVVVAAVTLLASSRTALVDLPNQYLRTGDAPLRVWTVALPMIASVMGTVALVRRSAMLAAAATGVLAPSMAFAGSLGLSLFLNESSAFADAGVAVSLGAAFVGVAMLLRWFVYHPADLLGDESRPSEWMSWSVLAVGASTGVVVVATAVLDDGSWSSSFVFQTVLVTVVPLVLVASGVVRTRPAMVLAACASAAQIVGVVVVVWIERSEVAIDSDLVLRTGVTGLVLLLVGVVLSAAAFARHHVDAPADVVDDDADWRWTAAD